MQKILNAMSSPQDRSLPEKKQNIGHIERNHHFKTSVHRSCLFRLEWKISVLLEAVADPLARFRALKQSYVPMCVQIYRPLLPSGLFPGVFSVLVVAHIAPLVVNRDIVCLPPHGLKCRTLLQTAQSSRS